MMATAIRTSVLMASFGVIFATPPPPDRQLKMNDRCDDGKGNAIKGCPENAVCTRSFIEIYPPQWNCMEAEEPTTTTKKPAATTTAKKTKCAAGEEMDTARKTCVAVACDSELACPAASQRCVAAPRQCFTTPCPQFECTSATAPTTTTAPAPVDECGPNSAIGPCPPSYCRQHPTHSGCTTTTPAPTTAPPKACTKPEVGQGKEWNECGSACGAKVCGVTDGGMMCPPVCVAQCECPRTAPFFDKLTGACVAETECTAGCGKGEEADPKQDGKCVATTCDSDKACSSTQICQPSRRVCKTQPCQRFTCNEPECSSTKPCKNKCDACGNGTCLPTPGAPPQCESDEDCAEQGAAGSFCDRSGCSAVCRVATKVSTTTVADSTTTTVAGTTTTTVADTTTTVVVDPTTVVVDPTTTVVVDLTTTVTVVDRVSFTTVAKPEVTTASNPTTVPKPKATTTTTTVTTTTPQIMTPTPKIIVFCQSNNDCLKHDGVSYCTSMQCLPFAKEGEMCHSTLPPLYQIKCDAATKCTSSVGSMPGAPGTCTKVDPTTDAPVVATSPKGVETPSAPMPVITEAVGPVSIENTVSTAVGPFSTEKPVRTEARSADRISTVMTPLTTAGPVGPVSTEPASSSSAAADGVSTGAVVGGVLAGVVALVAAVVVLTKKGGRGGPSSLSEASHYQSEFQNPLATGTNSHYQSENGDIAI